MCVYGMYGVYVLCVCVVFRMCGLFVWYMYMQYVLNMCGLCICMVFVYVLCVFLWLSASFGSVQPQKYTSMLLSLPCRKVSI